MPTAFSYLRFSSPEQSNGDSVRRQTEVERRRDDRVRDELFVRGRPGGAAVRCAVAVGHAHRRERAPRLSRSIRRRLRHGAVRAWSVEPPALTSTPVARALGRCTDAYEALVRHMEEPDAG